MPLLDLITSVLPSLRSAEPDADADYMQPQIPISYEYPININSYTRQVMHIRFDRLLRLVTLQSSMDALDTA